LTEKEIEKKRIEEDFESFSADLLLTTDSESFSFVLHCS
jgi:hypothetical protein